MGRGEARDGMTQGSLTIMLLMILERTSTLLICPQRWAKYMSRNM